jgi:hypothetical protein
MIISAYLNLFDDWDILKSALLSVIDRVDEIVVVDGAYRWMLPYFNKMGRDPMRSLPQVYEVLSELGPKIRVINGVWENELEKRIAGYDACKGRYRYRIDADEIFFFDEAATEKFLKSDYSVGQMDMPLYVAPGYIAGVEGQKLPRQAFLFDSDKISALEHLSYLWLVLPEWERKKFGAPQPSLIFPESLAFNAHLTHWRPPSSSLSRARFYVMNYMREHGAPLWATEKHNQPIVDFAPVFEKILPTEFDEMLLGKLLVVIPSSDQLTCRKTPLTQAQERGFSYVYDEFLTSLAELNFGLVNSCRTIPRGENYYLDATLSESLPVGGADNTLVIAFSDQLAGVRIEMSSFFLDQAYNNMIPLDVKINGNIALTSVPHLPSESGLLRRMVSIAVWSQNDKQTLKFRFLPG